MRLKVGVMGVALAAVTVGGSAGAAGAARHGPKPITKSVHVAFEGRPAKTTVLAGAMSGRVFKAGQVVSILVVLRNESAQPCGGGLQDHPPLPVGSDRLVVGLCGQMALTVRGTSGRLVYPGPIAINCPLIPDLVVAAHGSVGTAATWNQMIYPAKQTLPYASEVAPAGRYVLTIDGKLSFPITLTR